jgi:hypothetical protein
VEETGVWRRQVCGGDRCVEETGVWRRQVCGGDRCVEETDVWRRQMCGGDRCLRQACRGREGTATLTRLRAGTGIGHSLHAHVAWVLEAVGWWLMRIR